MSYALMIYRSITAKNLCPIKKIANKRYVKYITLTNFVEDWKWKQKTSMQWETQLLKYISDLTAQR